MIASFCGAQSGMTDWQGRELEKVFRHFNVAELCYRDYIGSDARAVDIALSCGVKNFHIYPINDSKKRAFSFPKTDKLYEWIGFESSRDGLVHYKMEPIQAPLFAGAAIVRDSEILISTPKEFVHVIQSGTWAVIRKAWHAKKEVIVIPPIERMENETDEGQSTE